ncbi:MAG: hypothetical protein E7461_03150 [Ruminococcaceae bacterium]|nr:hypothetical protein [Oscillospiraceae bacterium]
MRRNNHFGRFLALLLTFTMVLPLAACVPPAVETPTEPTDPPQQLVVPEGYSHVTVGALTGVNIYGTSVEFDPHFFSAGVQRGVFKEEDWAIVERRVKEMGIDRFRVMLRPSWLEPLNDDADSSVINWDALTTDSVEMRSLYKVLDLAQENGIDVNLTLWGAEAAISLADLDTMEAIKAQGGHFLAKGNSGNNWMIGTLYPEEFAETFSAYVQLLQQKGYTCITEVTPVNEPCWSYIINNEVSFEAYKELCLALDARFKADGIRDSVLFNLSDNTDVRAFWLENTMTELDEITDIYNSHTYIFGYNTPNSDILAWEEENINITRNTGKPHVIGEFGSNQNTGSTRQSDIDLYERGVLLVREMLNFYNAGAAGASYWVLFDQYYALNASYSEMMMLGLWKGSKELYYPDQEYYRTIEEDYEVRPQYYAFSLMSKHVQKGAEVYPIDLKNDFAAGTAFKGEDGKWVYVLANGNAEGDALKLALQNGELVGEYEVYVYSRDALPAGDSLIAASETLTTENLVLTLELAPQSVVLLRQK